MKKNFNCSMNYSTFASQPDISQIQSVPDRSDPLNIREGNPLLKPEYGHNISLGFQHFHPTKLYSIFGSINGTYTEDRIMETILVDANFVRHYRPQNTSGEVRMGGNIYFSYPVNKWKSSFHIGTNGDYSKGQVIISEQLSYTTNTSSSQSLSWSYSPTEWLVFDAGANFSQNAVHYDLDSAFEQTYTSRNYNMNLSLTLPGQFMFNSNLSIAVNKGRNDGYDQNVPIWDAEISRSFLKGERLSISLSASDLLNRNIGLGRQVELNFIEERKSQTLSRYFLLRVHYLLRAF